MVVLTDGVSNDPSKTITAANSLLKEDVTVFAAGIGSGVNEAELEAIASDPDCNHLTLLPSFDSFDLLVKKIEKKACQGLLVVVVACCCCCLLFVVCCCCLLLLLLVVCCCCFFVVVGCLASKLYGVIATI